MSLGQLRVADVRGGAGERADARVRDRAGRARAPDRRRRRAGDAVPGPHRDHAADEQERGLLSIAFAPDYATVGALLRLPDGAADPRARSRSGSTSARLADPNVADPATGRLLLAIPHPDATNHNGGQLQIGPDGKLWLATGDGGGGNNQFGHSQDPASRLGKLLRLDPAAPAAVEQLAQRAAQPVALLVRAGRPRS